MKLILIGPPGAGKGTQAASICERFAIVQISTGDMLRAAIAAGTPLGRKVQAIVDRGDLVDDGTVVDLVRARIAQDDCRNGFLFDGFPRTLGQAEALSDAGITVDHVLEISVPDDVVVRRLSGRRVHTASGRTYHIEHDPPQRQGFDDHTGDPLVQRADDEESTVRDRLRVYREHTRPLISFYRNLAASKSIAYTTIDGGNSLDNVRNDIVRALEDSGSAAKKSNNPH